MPKAPEAPHPLSRECESFAYSPTSVLRSRDNLIVAFHVEIEPFVDPAPLLSVLPANERARAAVYATPLLRTHHVVAHAMLARVLTWSGAAQPLAYRRDAYGKPSLATPCAQGPLHFNLTHTNGFAACIVSRTHIVGIDAECVLPSDDLRDVARLVFSPPERAWLDTLTTGENWIEGFYALWTLKEALMKAVGLGFSMTPSDITLDITSNRLIDAPGLDPSAWQFYRFSPTTRHRLAVAIEARDDRRPALEVHPLALSHIESGCF